MRMTMKAQGITPTITSNTDQAIRMRQAGRFNYFNENELVGQDAIKADGTRATIASRYGVRP